MSGTSLDRNIIHLYAPTQVQWFETVETDRGKRLGAPMMREAMK